MSISDIFYTTTQNAAAQHEDMISLLAFLAEQTVETINDVEPTTKLTFSLLSHLFQDDFHHNFLSMLHNLKTDDHILVSSFKIHVHDKYMFKLLLLLSLKYKKSIFMSDSCSFLQNVLYEILDSISITKYQSLHLLRLLELILKKRDVCTPDLSLSILKTMNQAAHSPLTGFKNWAHNVSRIVLRSLPCDSKKHLCNFNNLPIKGIDLNDILKQFEERDIRPFFPIINKQILNLFCTNTDSREGSFYYDTITKVCTFQQFIDEIWPHYRPNLFKFNEGEFYQSFLKYWIPITVKQYKSDFYVFVAKTDVHYQIKAYTLLETRKRGFYCKPEFNTDTLAFVRYLKTSSIGLKIVSTYVKKHDRPEPFEIQAVLLYLDLYCQFVISEDVLKSLKRFLSQIFIVSHITLNKNVDLNLYSSFLRSIFNISLTLMSDSESCEVAAQILKVIWDIAAGSSSDLVTSYKIDRENTYEVGGNLYYRELKSSGFWEKTFLNPLLIQKIQNLLQKFKFCPNLARVTKDRYLEVLNMTFPSLVGLETEIRTSICLQSSEKIRIYSDLIVAYKSLDRNDVTALCELFGRKIESFESQNMFTCVLILDILIVVLNHHELNVVPLLEKSLMFLDEVFDENVGCKLNAKESKVLEALINNVIECLSVSKPHWSQLEKNTLFRHLVKIIQVSNMKRPVSLAANLVNLMGASMETCEDKPVKIRLLDQTLLSLYNNKQDGKIRRNPETRLVIHALCLSDKNQTKPFLVSSLNFMLEVLADPLSSDSTLSSTLHSLEVLVSDNSIHQFTLPFMVDIIKNCIQLFNRPSWIVRNADLQLLKSLIERFLGVSLDENVRPKTVEDLFILFPELIPYFYEILSREEPTDSALMVLLFFSSSQIKNDFFVRKSLAEPFDKFRSLFVANIFANRVGFLTVEAFASLCPNTDIPRVFSGFVDYIQRHFVTMDKNVFADLIKLLQKLHHKYESSLVRTEDDVIKRSINALVIYLRPFNYFYFNLLSLKLFTVDDIADKIVACLSHDYKTRIWLNNYLPFVMVRINLHRLDRFLKTLMLKPLPEFLQSKILSVLVDRSTEQGFPVPKIVTTLILKLTTLNEDSTFLITAYSKTILLLSDLTPLFLSSDVITGIRQDFQTCCIYKVFVYIMALSCCNCRCDSDKIFITNSIQMYIASVEDDDILVDLSTTITHLYKIVPVNERYDVIKLIFYLLLNEFTAFEMCKFVSWLTDSQSSSVLISLVNLLDCSKLSDYVGDRRLACKLLSECYRYVDDLPEDLEESDTYYVIESELSIPKHHVKAVILKSFEEFVMEDERGNDQEV